VSKADKIRAALAGGVELSKPDLEAAIGEALKYAPTVHLPGELVSRIGDAGLRVYRLGKPQKRAKKKTPRRLKGHMAEKREREAKTLKEIAKRPGLSALTLDNYVGATELLIKTIEQEVEGLQDNPLLATALANHKRAEAMFNATRAG
jgi:hypothetical protein